MMGGRQDTFHNCHGLKHLDTYKTVRVGRKLILEVRDLKD